MKKTSALSTIGSFLLLEILAFVAFGLSGSYIAYALLGAAILIIMAIAHFKQINSEGLSSVLLFIFPLVIFGLCNALGGFASGNGENIFFRILIPIGFLCFAGVGYLSSLADDFSINTALLVIYGALALVVLISFGYTMIQYVPFYTLIYGDEYIFYDGSKASESIGNTAYFLLGFKLQEVSVSYFSLFPSVLSTAVIALFFISPKENKRNFILYCIYAAIGIIALIFTPTKMTLITDVCIILAILIIVLFGKNHIKSKVFSIIMIVFAVLFGLGLLVFVLNSQSWSFLSSFQSFIANNYLLNRIFNANGLAVNYNMILSNIFVSGALIGYYPIDAYGNYVPNSNSILFDTFITSGIIGFIFLVVALIFAGMAVVRYYKNSGDKLCDKSLILGFLVVFFGYSIVNYDMQPYVYYSNFIPFYENGLFLVALFLIGYVFTGAYPKKVEVTEAVEVQPEVVEEAEAKEEAHYEI